MNRGSAAKVSVVSVLLMAALAAGTDTSKPISVRRCPRFGVCIHQEPQEAHQRGVRRGLRESGFSAGDPFGRCHLLADCRDHAFVRAERKAAVCWEESYRQRQSLSAGWFGRLGDCKDRAIVRSEVKLASKRSGGRWTFCISNFVAPGRAGPESFHRACQSECGDQRLQERHWVEVHWWYVSRSSAPSLMIASSDKPHCYGSTKSTLIRA